MYQTIETCMICPKQLGSNMKHFELFCSVGCRRCFLAMDVHTRVDLLEFVFAFWPPSCQKNITGSKDPENHEKPSENGL